MKILGTRKAIQDALAYAYPADSSMAEYLDYSCRIDKSRRTGIEQHVMAIQFAKIRAAINEQPAPIPEWLYYCYGPDLELANKSKQKRLISQMLAPKLHKMYVSPFKRDRLEKLCLCTIEDYRLGLFSAQRLERQDLTKARRLPIVVYCELLDVHDNHWTRDWEAYRKKAMGLIGDMDDKGISHVSIIVREIREAEYDGT